MRKRVIARPVGSSVRLKCTASGNPRPDIVWLKDNRPLVDEDGGGGGDGKKKKWTLSLRNLMPEHSGKYTCHVSNRAGEINATYKVEVIREFYASFIYLRSSNFFERETGWRWKVEKGAGIKPFPLSCEEETACLKCPVPDPHWAWKKKKLQYKRLRNNHLKQFFSLHLFKHWLNNRNSWFTRKYFCRFEPSRVCLGVIVIAYFQYVYTGLHMIFVYFTKSVILYFLWWIFWSVSR